MGFADAIAKFAQKANVVTDEVVQELAVEIGGRLIHRTPVESGAARGNWRAGIGGYSTAETGQLDKGGAATVENIAHAVAGAKAGQVVYLTNTLPYILSLEHGHSDRAPNGMVAVTMTEAPRLVANIAGRIRQGDGK